MRPLKYILLLTLGIVLTACYSENYEDLLGQEPGQCDTPLSSWSQDIEVWINVQCVSCHNENSGIIDLSSYQKVAASASTVLDRIKREPGQPGFMPQGGMKLEPCVIKGFEKWIDLGTPQN